MKTAFKRIALVAAAALAIGGISAVSAQAAGTSDWYITATSTNVPAAGASITAETATQIAGPGNNVTLNNNYVGSLYFTVTGGTTTTGTTSGTVGNAVGTVNPGGGSVVIATPAVGTITVNSYEISALGAASTTATSTVTITVVAALPQTVYGSAQVYAGPGTATQANSSTDSTFSVSAPSSSINVANFSINELDNSATPLQLTSGWKAITVSATNGLINSHAGNPPGTSSVSATTYASVTQTAAGIVGFDLSGINGLAGTSTVTISVNGVVAKTYTVTFTGTAVKLVLTAVNPVIAVGTAPVTNITANTNALEVQEFDINGNAVAITPGNITVTSAASTTATAGAVSNTVGVLGVNFLGGTTSGTALSSTVAGVSLNGVAAGTTTFTATDSTTVSGTTLTSSPVSVRVSSGVPTTVVFSTDAASYAAGAAGTLTTTLSDAAGTLPAGTYTVFTAGSVSSSYALTVGMLNAYATQTVNDAGVATLSFNAPISDATGVTISATPPASSTIVITPATFSVASGASDAANAATDAANEATDAANAATDAANAAADSADAATQAAQDAGDKADAALTAVTALSQQVTTLLAKVASLASTLAKITAAIAKLPKK